MRMPPLQPRSRLAHEAAAWARAQGAFPAMNASIFRAFFERGEDIGNAEVLATLAARSGLDEQDLRRTLGAHEFLEQVLRDEEWASRIGLSGVPAFIFGRNYLVGVQSADSLEQFVRTSE
jgi:predicted DsbA family dithiol-disulfide isomerase